MVNGCIYLLLVFLLANTSRVGDRLIMEINNTAYTQSQIEVYLVLKDALRLAENKTVEFANDGNWTRKLSEFKSDFILDHEALRLGGFNPSDSMIKAAQGIYQKRIERDTSLKEFINHMNVDDKTLQRTITTALRIESFRRNKEKQASLKTEAEPKVWMDEFEERASFRFFEGAREYRALEPG